MHVRTIQQSAKSVSVYTRHSADCPQRSNPQWKRCKCPKWLYIYENGKDKPQSAKTRSWAEAERQAQEKRDAWDPIKRKLHELSRQQQAADREPILVEDALNRWLSSKKQVASGTLVAYRGFTRKVLDWAALKQLQFVSEITPDALDEWRGQWSPDAKRCDDRMSFTTQSEFLIRLRNFFDYALRNGWISSDPTFHLESIKPDSKKTMPLTREQFKELMDATEEFDEIQRRECDRFGREMQAVFLLMRWSGLRIGDVLALPRRALAGNRLEVVMQKTKRKLQLVIPDHVVQALHALPMRETTRPDYFFWSKGCNLKSLSTLWVKRIQRLNEECLNFEDENGDRLDFHSHMLRDTFAVEMLLAAVPLEDVSKMLGHKSIKITEKFYAPWIRARQLQLESKMIAAMQQMGASVSL